ncbi:MAG: Histidinol dehydrogenase [Pelosinus sp.]|nr:Histidinol dehydrogenase [Pelosinus sp.]
MKIVYAKDTTSEALAELLKKPPFDQVSLGDSAKNHIKKVFASELTAPQVVERIIHDIRLQGDEALLRYTQDIDGISLTAETLEVTAAEFEEALEQVDGQILAAIRQAIANVKSFHTEQLPKTWLTYREHGTMLGQSCIPLERVGIYVPGGTAIYPSSVIMNAVPAVVAGVKEIIMVVPPSKDGSVNPNVLAAAQEAGVTRVFKAGGAQAIAALAFGTKLIPKVDKITGPGNIFVTLAKKAVYGHCDIDMLAGPSEILIVADETANPSHIAADMLSQAEHDVLASSILITDSSTLVSKVEIELQRQLAELPRMEIAEASLKKNGLMIVVQNIMEAIELANISAPEHLEIITEQPFTLLPYVKNAGAVFLGNYSPEPLGDYLAGPNHVLPTGGTARFYSVLNVETFMKKTSIIAYSKKALQAVANQVITLAEAEGLEAHANAIRVRGKE